MSFVLARRLAGAAVLLASLAATAAAQAETQLTFYGHSAFKLTTPTGKVLFIDPWIANPANPNGKKDLDAIDKADLVLLTHGHGDHIGNAVDIGKKTGAQLVANFDLQKAMVQYRGYPKEQATAATAGSFGGEIALLDGEVRVAFVPAVHGNSIETAQGDLKEAGLPGGLLISVKNGPVIYHAGDTDLFADMALVNQFRPVDVFLVPIGDKFTMGPKRAALAAKLVAPKRAVVPMHFGTFPALTGTPAEFQQELKAAGVRAEMKEMKPGEAVTF